MSAIQFTIEKKLEGTVGRAGTITTPHGLIPTPAFAVVGTKATVKAITPRELREIGADIFLANTYHLEMRPGSELIKKAGGLHKFSGWDGPMMTDSGGFQAFSLGAAYGKGITKFTRTNEDSDSKSEDLPKIAKVTDEGVEFKSEIDGTVHFFSPEHSIEIQHNLGADIIVAFDEPTTPHAPIDYQKIALKRTHTWAKRCFDYHKAQKNSEFQALFGVVQGGKYPELRQESANFLGSIPFDGYAIGGSYNKNDIGEVVALVNGILPEDKPKHLLGIGEPLDIFDGVEAGCDTFDCVMPTRNARNGSLFTKSGKINIGKSEFITNLNPIESDCPCYTCKNFSLAYLSHLLRSKEILFNTLTSIHNVYFLVNLVKGIRNSILDNSFFQFKADFTKKYLNS